MSRYPIVPGALPGEGNALWQSLSDDDTYEEQWHGTVDELRELLELPMLPEFCRTCGRHLLNLYPYCSVCWARMCGGSEWSEWWIL